MGEGAGGCLVGFTSSAEFHICMMDGVRSRKSEDGQGCKEEERNEAEEVVMHFFSSF